MYQFWTNNEETLVSLKPKILQTLFHTILNNPINKKQTPLKKPKAVKDSRGGGTMGHILAYPYGKKNLDILPGKEMF